MTPGATVSTGTGENRAQGWQWSGRLVLYPGFAFGSRSPVMLARLTGEPLRSADRQAIEALLDNHLDAVPMATTPGPVRRGRGVPEPATALAADARWFLTLLDGIRSTGEQVMPARSYVIAAGATVDMAVPCFASDAGSVNALLHALLALIVAVVRQEPTEPLQEQLDRCVAALRSARSTASNVGLFMRAAAERDLPVRDLPDVLVQFGCGHRARWFWSSATDDAGFLGMFLARRKQLTNAILRQAGIPVAEQVAVESLDAALAAADRFGYPVVIKPGDLDGGVGVAAGLADAAELRLAWERCRAHSQHILLERHIEGRDYRLNVFHDRVIWAIERVPGGVTGNGQDSIETLVDAVNRDPRRGDSKKDPLVRLVIDEEAIALLRRANLTPASVPAAGQFVRMRRIANVAVGGSPRAAFHEVHPDNAELAVRATQMLRLDIAGIDLIIPDVRRSWLETGAVICEVNGQPTLGQTTSAHLYGQVLDTLVPEDGRVPVVAVVGAAAPAQVAAIVARTFSGPGVGVVDEQGVWIDGQCIHPGPVTSFAGGRMLALDPAVTAVVLCINDVSVLSQGLPFDRFALVVLAGTAMAAANSGIKTDPPQVLDATLRFLWPACQGEMVPLALPELAGFRGGAVWQADRPITVEDLPGRVMRACRLGPRTASG